MAIEREKIIDEAVRLLDEGGIEAVTTRRLADRLNVQQPALYWHFRNKQELLDAVNERIMAEGHTRRAPKPGESWQEFLRANARSFRKALLAHPDGARIHAGTRPAAADMASLEAQLQIYLDAGFDGEAAINAGIAIGRYVVGAVLEEQAGDPDHPFDQATIDREFEGYPLMREIVSAAIRPDPLTANERAFEAGLDLIVQGLEAKLAGR